MFDNNTHRKIQKKLREINEAHIANEKENGTYSEHDNVEVPNNSLSPHLKGFEKEYKKQVPVIGAGKINMEIEEKPKRKSLKNLPLVYQTAVENNIEGGNIPNYQDEYTDQERYRETQLMGAGGDEEEEIHIERNIGGSKKSKKVITNTSTNTKKVVEVVEGSDTATEPKQEKTKKKPGRPKKVVEIDAPPVVKKSRGRPRKVAVVEEPEIIEEKEIITGSGSGSMIQRRGNLIKTIMKEQGLSLIKVSQYIKQKGLKY